MKNKVLRVGVIVTVIFAVVLSALLLSLVQFHLSKRLFMDWGGLVYVLASTRVVHHESMTEDQLQQLSLYFGFTWDKAEDVTDYYYYFDGDDSYVAFTAQIDQAEMDAFLEKYDVAPVDFDTPISVGREFADGLLCNQRIGCSVSPGNPGIEGYSTFTNIYRLSDGDGYFFFVFYPQSEIKFYDT